MFYMKKKLTNLYWKKQQVKKVAPIQQIKTHC